jgi:hypothetical protein
MSSSPTFAPPSHARKAGLWNVHTSNQEPSSIRYKPENLCHVLVVPFCTYFDLGGTLILHHTYQDTRRSSVMSQKHIDRVS